MGWVLNHRSQPGKRAPRAAIWRVQEVTILSIGFFRPALIHLSYRLSIGALGMDLNPHPSAYKAAALPLELQGRIWPA